MIIKVGTQVDSDYGKGVVTAITEEHILIKRHGHEVPLRRGYDAIWIPAEFEKGTNCEDGYWQWVPAKKEGQ